jgi:methionyl-tRNA synthetase
MKRVLIGLSWPYANGRLHIGHVASSLPADALARFHRSIGNKVSFVTGSDCYGTPIMVRAAAEKISPQDLAEKYHEFHKKDFAALGFTFDNYDKTLSKRHHDFVKAFHTQMYKSDYVYEKTAMQLYCPKCKKFLPDRYVEGICPHCGKAAKGDSCDNCGKILEPEELKNPECQICRTTPEAREQTQLYLKLSALQGKIQKFFDERKEKWTVNAQGMTQRYLNEGLHDRAITRSLAWGIDIPREGWDDRKIYIWAENVLGYLSASETEFITDKNSLHYYVHGKDNIPFHSIILSGLILAHGNGAADYHLPDVICASEYITVGGEKLSKSKGNQIFAYTLYENFDVDAVRFFFLRNVNDKRDSNFTLEDFVNTINGELINNFGNLVNRTLSFVKSKFGGKIERVKLDKEIDKAIKDMQKEYATLMLGGHVSAALKCVIDLVNFSNKYFDDCKPWISVKTDEKKCKQNIYEIVEIIRAAVDALEPFIPTACGKVKGWLAGSALPEIGVLWQRLELATVENIFKGK